MLSFLELVMLWLHFVCWKTFLSSVDFFNPMIPLRRLLIQSFWVVFLSKYMNFLSLGFDLFHISFSVDSGGGSVEPMLDFADFFFIRSVSVDLLVDGFPLCRSVDEWWTLKCEESIGDSSWQLSVHCLRKRKIEQ